MEATKKQYEKLLDIAKRFNDTNTVINIQATCIINEANTQNIGITLNCGFYCLVLPDGSAHS